MNQVNQVVLAALMLIAGCGKKAEGHIVTDGGKKVDVKTDAKDGLKVEVTTKGDGPIEKLASKLADAVK